MKKIIATTLAAAGLFSSGMAQAAGADLSVKGRLQTGACSVVLGGGGVIDLGSMTPADLVDQSYTGFEPPAIALTVTCSTATKFGLRMQDNRAGTTVNDGNGAYFGLGTARGKNIGLAYHTVRNAASNGLPLQMLEQWARIPWRNVGSHGFPFYTAPDFLMSFTTIASSNAPLALTQVSAELKSDILIDDPETSGLDLSHQVQIDGSSTLELVYL